MEKNQKSKPAPDVIEDDVAFYQEAARAMRQGLAQAAASIKSQAEALIQQAQATKAALASRPIIADYSRKIEAGSFPVQVNYQWVDVPAAGFLGWLFQAGYIEEYSQSGEIRHLGYRYTEQEFLEWLHPLDSLLAAYFKATGTAPEWPDDEWIAEIREIQEGGELPAEEYTPEQVASLYEYYNMNKFSHPNEKAL